MFLTTFHQLSTSQLKQSVLLELSLFPCDADSLCNPTACDFPPPDSLILCNKRKGGKRICLQYEEIYENEIRMLGKRVL